MKTIVCVSLISSVVLMAGIALGGSTWTEVFRGFGSGDSHDNACSAANANATMNAIVACTAHRPVGTQADVNDKGCSCQCNKIGDDKLCTCTDTVIITCQSLR